MTTHTPGPWKRNGLTVYALIADSDRHYRTENKFSLLIQNYRHWCSQEELEANAQLIAAAPDMLEALEAFAEAWEKSHQLEKTDLALRKANDALRKARGEAKPSCPCGCGDEVRAGGCS